MENENQITSGKDQEASSKIDDMVSYESHKKLLGEKKKMQERLLKMQEQLESIEQDKLQAEGKKDELIQSLKSEVNKYKTFAEDTTKRFAKTSITSQIVSEATKQGCKDGNTLMKLLGSDVFENIDMDENFNIQKESLESIIERAKKETEHLALFKKNNVNVNNTTPAFERTKGKSLNEMSSEELIAAIKNAE